MEDTMWRFGVSTTSKSYQSMIKSLSDLCIEYEEVEDEEDLRADYSCPYCDDDFDLVELCCHIDDEHLYESKPGVCPVCCARIGSDMVGHIMTQHGNIVKSLHRLKLRRGESESNLSFLKKELQDDYLHTLFSTKPAVTSSKTAPDPLLSFVSTVSSTAKSDVSQPKAPVEPHESSFGLNDEPSEKTKRCVFVRGLMLSAIFGDC